MCLAVKLLSTTTITTIMLYPVHPGNAYNLIKKLIEPFRKAFKLYIKDECEVRCEKNHNGRRKNLRCRERNGRGRSVLHQISSCIYTIHGELGSRRIPHMHTVLCTALCCVLLIKVRILKATRPC